MSAMMGQDGVEPIDAPAPQGGAAWLEARCGRVTMPMAGYFWPQTPASKQASAGAVQSNITHGVYGPIRITIIEAQFSLMERSPLVSCKDQDVVVTGLNAKLLISVNASPHESTQSETAT